MTDGGGISLGVRQTPFLPGKTWPGAFSKLQQNQTDIAALPVPQQAQPFGGESRPVSQGDQLPQPFGAMHQEKVPSEFQGPGGAAEQILC